MKIFIYDLLHFPYMFYNVDKQMYWLYYLSGQVNTVKEDALPHEESWEVL